MRGDEREKKHNPIDFHVFIVVGSATKAIDAGARIVDSDIMTDTFFTAAQAAQQVGCSERTIQRRARDHGIGRRLGLIFMLSAADISALRAVVRSGPGNPNFVRRKDLGQVDRAAKKKRKK